MPYAAASVCAHIGCQALVRGQSYCEDHQEAARERARAYEQRRGSSSKRLYDSRWQEARREYLHGKRCTCGAPAMVIDHIVPHRGDTRLFWDQSNWQPMCGPCHNSKTARQDGGFGNRVGRGG